MTNHWVGLCFLFPMMCSTLFADDLLKRFVPLENSDVLELEKPDFISPVALFPLLEIPEDLPEIGIMIETVNLAIKMCNNETLQELPNYLLESWKSDTEHTATKVTYFSPVARVVTSAKPEAIHPSLKSIFFVIGGVVVEESGRQKKKIFPVVYINLKNGQFESAYGHFPFMSEKYVGILRKEKDQFHFQAYSLTKNGEAPWLSWDEKGAIESRKTRSASVFDFTPMSLILCEPKSIREKENPVKPE